MLFSILYIINTDRVLVWDEEHDYNRVNFIGVAVSYFSSVLVFLDSLIIRIALDG